MANAPSTFSRRRALTLAAGAAALAVSAPTAALAQTPLAVVATTGMLADAATVLGGDRVAVRGLMGPGVDPHAYRQTRTDIAAMASADLVLWHGLFLEAQMEDFLRALADRTPTLAAAEGLDPALLLSHDEYDGKFDPHVWMDPRLWERVTAAVRDALSETDPGGAEAYAAAFARYSQELSALHAYAEEVLGAVPPESRVLLTAHDAFGYFGTAYGFEVVGVQGVSTESEAGLNRISTLVDMLVERRIGAVFVESSVSDRNMRALAEGAAARGHEVRIGGSLFSDAMGAPGSYEGTYLGMIDHNVTTIARALGADAPAQGRLGRLAA